MGTVQGPAAIQAFMEKAIPGPNAVHNYHVLSNFVIDVNGDTATAWSRWMFMVPGPNNTAVAAQSGRYDDTLVREDGALEIQAAGRVERHSGRTACRRRSLTK